MQSCKKFIKPNFVWMAVFFGLVWYGIIISDQIAVKIPVVTEDDASYFGDPEPKSQAFIRTKHL